MWYFCTPSVLELIYHRVRHLWEKKTLSVYLFHSWVSLILYFLEERPLQDVLEMGLPQNSRNSAVHKMTQKTSCYYKYKSVLWSRRRNFLFLGYFSVFLHSFVSFKWKGFGKANITDESRFKTSFVWLHFSLLLSCKTILFSNMLQLMV